MAFTDYKSVFLSKTMWAGVVTIGASLAAIFGIQVGAEEQLAASELLLALSTSVVTLVAGVGTLYGRWKADKALKA